MTLRGRAKQWPRRTSDRSDFRAMNLKKVFKGGQWWSKPMRQRMRSSLPDRNCVRERTGGKGEHEGRTMDLIAANEQRLHRSIWSFEIPFSGSFPPGNRENTFSVGERASSRPMRSRRRERKHSLGYQGAMNRPLRTAPLPYTAGSTCLPSACTSFPSCSPFFGFPGNVNARKIVATASQNVTR